MQEERFQFSQNFQCEEEFFQFAEKKKEGSEFV